ncbi:MAG: hypothetical protein ABI888_00630 [Chloroflexota bacterium]
MRPLFALLAVAAVVASCGSLTDQASGVAARPTSELLYLATPTGMAIVDATADRLVATLPQGVLLPDRSAYWTVEPAMPKTRVRRLDPVTGSDTMHFALDGEWALPATYGPAPSGISRNGGWMVLIGPKTTTSTGIVNRIAVVDLAKGKIDRVITATGDVSFDAVSDDGRNVYLVEHLVPSPHYVVRVASFQGSGLADGVLGQIKTAEPEVMNGLYHASVAVSGDWFLSLYSNPTRGPFIHALNTTQLYAQCILNMPDVAVALRPAWAMVLDTKHPILYAVNGPGGAVSEVDTVRLVVRRSNVDLAPAATALSTSPLHPAALSSDSTRLYVAGEHGVLVILTGDLSVRSRYLQDKLVDSLAVSEDGQRLFIVSGGDVLKIEAGTGKTLGRVASAPPATGILAISGH